MATIQANQIDVKVNVTSVNGAITSFKQLKAAVDSFRQANNTAATSSNNLAAAVTSTTNAINTQNAAVNSSTSSLNQMSQAHQGVANASNSAGRASAGFISSLQGAAAAIYTIKNIGDAIFSIGKYFYDVGIQADRFERSLTLIAGSAGSAYLKELRSDATRLGIDFGETAKSMIQFMNAVNSSGAAGVNAQRVFTTVSQSVMAMGGSSQQVEGALRALQQMLSKGVVQSEELKGQLAEHLPGAMGVAARAMNMSVAELMAALRTGTVESSNFVNKFANQLEKEAGPALDSFGKSNEAAINRAKNEWEEFLKTVGKVMSSIGGSMAPYAEKALSFVNNRNDRNELLNQWRLLYKNVPVDTKNPLGDDGMRRRQAIGATDVDVERRMMQDLKIPKEYQDHFKAYDPITYASRIPKRIKELDDEIKANELMRDQTPALKANTEELWRRRDTLKKQQDAIRNFTGSFGVGLPSSDGQGRFSSSEAQTSSNNKIADIDRRAISTAERNRQTSRLNAGEDPDLIAHQEKLKEIKAKYEKAITSIKKQDAPGAREAIAEQESKMNYAIAEENAKFKRKGSRASARAARQEEVLDNKVVGPIKEYLSIYDQLIVKQNALSGDVGEEVKIRLRATELVDTINNDITKTGRTQSQILDDLVKRNMLTEAQKNILESINFSEKDAAISKLVNIQKQNDELEKQQKLQINITRLQEEYVKRTAAIKGQTASKMEQMISSSGMSLKNGYILPRTKQDDEVEKRRQMLDEYERVDRELNAKLENAKADNKTDPGVIAEIKREIADNAAAAKEAAREYDTLNAAIKSAQDSVDFGIWQGLNEYIESFPKKSAMASSMIKTFGSALEDSIFQYFKDGKGTSAIKNFFKMMMDQVSKLIIQLTIVRPLMNSMMGFGGFGLTGNFSSTQAPAPITSIAVPSANGNLFMNGVVHPFALGGIINQPTMTPVGMNLTGEAGPEGVFPLKRGRDGKLGVAAMGASGSTAVSVSMGDIIIQGGDTSAETAKAVQAVLKQIPDKVTEGIMKEKQRGGLLAR